MVIRNLNSYMSDLLLKLIQKGLMNIMSFEFN